MPSLKIVHRGSKRSAPPTPIQIGGSDAFLRGSLCRGYPGSAALPHVPLLPRPAVRFQLTAPLDHMGTDSDFSIPAVSPPASMIWRLGKKEADP